MANVQAIAIDTHASALQGALRGILAEGRRILIVGSPSGSFDHRLLRHERVVHWPSTEAKRDDGSRVLPAEVGAVLLTRQLSFELSNNVRHQAKQRNLVCPGESYSPGGINRVLVSVLTFPPVHGSSTLPVSAELEPPQSPSESQRAPMDADSETLVAMIDESIASLESGISGLQLLREQVVSFGARTAKVKEQLAALETLRSVLK